MMEGEPLLPGIVTPVGTPVFVNAYVKLDGSIEMGTPKTTVGEAVSAGALAGAETGFTTLQLMVSEGTITGAVVIGHGPRTR